MKTCTKCGEEKPLSEYYSSGRKNKHGETLLRANCKSCHDKQTLPHVIAYSMTPKGKATHKRYWQSPKGKEVAARNQKKMRAKNPAYALSQDQRSYFRLFLKHGYCEDTVPKMIGCDRETLRNHLESKFQPGMSWDNYGEWQVDHIFPLCIGDIYEWVHVDILWSYHNLQPLWKEQNRAKGTKMPWEWNKDQIN